MTEASAQLVMALRRLTDLPVRECQSALRNHGGDIGRAVKWMLAQHWFGDPPSVVWERLRRELSASGIDGTDMLGLDFVSESRQPLILPDAEVVAELTASGAEMSHYFLIDGLVCSINARGELMGCCIDDKDLSASAVAYLRRVGAREFSSFAEFQEWRTEAELGTAPDGGA